MPQDPTAEPATIPVTGRPFRIAITPDGCLAYVTTSVDLSDKDRLSVIDTASGAVITEIDVDGFGLGNDVAVTPDGRHVYVTTLRHVTVVDIATNQVVAKIRADNPFPSVNGVALAPDGREAYALVSHGGSPSGEVSVIDTASLTITARITLPSDPSGVEITPDGRRAYVSFFDGSPVVINLATHTVDTLPFSRLDAMAITPDSKRAYVPLDGSEVLSVIDLATHKVTGFVFDITMMGPIRDVVITPDGRRLYVAQGGSKPSADHNVVVFDTTTHKVTCCPASWSAAQPQTMAIAADGKRAYVTDRHRRAVFVVPVPESPPAPG